MRERGRSRVRADDFFVNKGFRRRSRYWKNGGRDTGDRSRWATQAVTKMMNFRQKQAWIPKHRPRSDFSRNSEWKSKLYSVYVGGLGSDVSLGALWKSFSTFGVVVDAYIPPCKSGLARVLAMVSSGIGGNRKLKRQWILVTILKFLDTLFQFLLLIKLHLILHNVKDSAKLESRSFKEVLCGQKRDESIQRCVKRSIEQEPPSNPEPSSNHVSSLVPLLLNIDIPKEDMEWLNRSVVGKSYRGVNCNEIKEELSKEGLLVQVAPLSNLKTLITFPSLSSMEVSLKKHVDTFVRFFDESHASALSKTSFKAAWILVEVESKGDIPNVISGNVSNIPFKIICSSFMAAQSSFLEDKTSGRESSNENQFRYSSPSSVNSLGTGKAISGSYNNLYDNVEGVNDRSANISLEKEECNVESPMLVNSCPKVELVDNQLVVPESNSNSGPPSASVRPWVTVRRSNRGKNKNLANIPIVSFDANLGSNSSTCQSPNRHTIDPLKDRIDETLRLCYQLGVEFDEDSELIRQEIGLIHGPRNVFRLLWGKGVIHGTFSDVIGKAGGLISIWKDDFFQMDSSIIYNRFLIILGTIKAINLKCAFVNIYAPNNDDERQSFFEDLSNNLSGLEVPICLCGDFNVVRYAEERSGPVSNSTALRTFNDFIEDWAFVDLPLSGSSFTWFKNSTPLSFSRIDRFLFSSHFLLAFPNISQKALPRSISDHNPIVLGCKVVDWGPKPFKIFNHWSEDDEFKPLVNSVWINNQNLDLWEKLKSIKPVVKSWASSKFGNLSTSIRDLESDIQQIENLLAANGDNSDLRNKLYKHKENLWKLMRAEERAIQQKSRMNWLNNGDRNSRYFHQMVALRNAQNNISSIKHNDLTLNDPAIDVSDGNKSPGPDGFNLQFFKNNWAVLKADLLKIFNDFFLSGRFDRKINSSFIALTAKCAAPSSTTDYRPISLVGSIYKIIAKVLARRLSQPLSALVNGVPVGFFGMQRGLRQGCPISPYLFCTVGQMLNFIFENALNLNLFRGVQVGNSSLSISHLQLYGIGVDESLLQNCANVVGCKIDHLPSVYLGLLIGARPSSVSIWRSVVERFLSRLSSWKAHHLSIAGRITLIKSVLNSLPLYFMSLFPLPVTVKTELDTRDTFYGVDLLIKRNFIGLTGIKSASPRKMEAWTLWILILKTEGCLKNGFGALVTNTIPCGPKLLWKKLIDIIRVRLAWWAKAKWPAMPYPVSDIIRCPENITSLRAKNGDRRKRVVSPWIKPPIGYLKFNVDGSARGKPGPGGIGGILRDHEGNCMVEFSKSVGRVDSNEAEFCVIREAILIYSASPWALSHPLIIESDSLNACGWINNPSGVPWKLRNISMNIDQLKTKIASWSIDNVPREQNSEADALAKSGVDRDLDYLNFS
ncbi:Endonuclease/exonuclease/phosphatase [Corchorus capsularis]|uniref:Endonuclease/exonuclease/phosphatase n=1 Tax=Corchorus capsularis TaxID=210143 RepID=A0A1R3GSS3_COCAP|nr:Endonuclease/exonuclease/phosphatase [Corchorus capsularis]